MTLEPWSDYPLTAAKEKGLVEEAAKRREGRDTKRTKKEEQEAAKEALQKVKEAEEV